MQENKTDVCVIGGGMVGSAVALGLAKLGLQVTIVETNMPQPFRPEQPPDIRMSAFSMASVALLEQLGAWQHIQKMRVCPYRRLAVWERSDCMTEFDAADINASHLGFFVENRLVQLGIHKALEKQSLVTWLADSRVKRISRTDTTRVEFEDGSDLICKLVIGADGASSRVREIAQIGTTGWRYQQHALGIKIKTTEPSQDITWQQFTPTGPVAFLPMYGGYASLIWYHQGEQIKYLKSLSTDKLKAQIIAHFPSQLPDFEILETASFPLTRMHANCYVRDSIVLMGDAAHTINPLAGQGVNLGFKDVAEFIQQMDSCLQTGGKINDEKGLKKYERARRGQNLLMMSAMDALYATFSNDFAPMKAIRNLGLKVADKTGVLKHQVMKYAMGLN